MSGLHCCVARLTSDLTRINKSIKNITGNNGKNVITCISNNASINGNTCDDVYNSNNVNRVNASNTVISIKTIYTFNASIYEHN